MAEAYSLSACTPHNQCCLLDAELAMSGDWHIWVHILWSVQYDTGLYVCRAMYRYSITFSENKFKMKSSSYILCSVWLLGIVMACLPLPLYGIDFFGSNGICFPLHLQHPYTKGWIYSVITFSCINTLAIVTVIVCYILLYIATRRSQKRWKSTKRAQDTAMAKRMLFIVITDIVMDTYYYHKNLGPRLCAHFTFLGCLAQYTCLTHQQCCQPFIVYPVNCRL